MRLLALISVLALLAAACGDDATPTSPTSTTPTTVTERFDAIIDLHGNAFYPFSVNQNGGAFSINFASLSPLNRPGLLNVPMQIGYGTVVKDDDGNVVGCELRKTVDATPALSSQLSDTLTAATNYCANIADIGNMRETANFSIRITHS